MLVRVDLFFHSTDVGAIALAFDPTLIDSSLIVIIWLNASNK